MSSVMTSELLFWPASRGVEMVVASTASTDPDRRRVLVKSRRVTVEVVSRELRDEDAGCWARTAKAATAAIAASPITDAIQRKRDIPSSGYQTAGWPAWLGLFGHAHFTAS